MSQTLRSTGCVVVKFTLEPEAVLKWARLSSHKDSRHLREEWDEPPELIKSNYY